MDRQPEITNLRAPPPPGQPVTAPAKGPAPQSTPTPRGWRAMLRQRSTQRILMWGVPLLVVAVGAYSYLTGGRYVSTDDAYVKAGMVTISADVAGRVTEIAVKESQRVKKGDVLFRLDERPYRFASERAQANLAQARLQVDQLRASYRQREAELQSARDMLDFQTRQYERNRALVANRTVSQAAFDQARQAMLAAQQSVASIQQQIAGILASLAGDAKIAIDKHPLVQQAQAQVDQAALDLDRVVVRAPVDGVATRVENLQVGQHLNVGAAAFALVSTRVWIEANFKETELTHMSVGNTARITVDAYPGKTFAAHIESIGAATGSEFSILPPQNASGNWVKVTQRLPVRLVIDYDDPSRPLRAGMSVVVEVDTRYRRAMLEVIDGAVAGGKR